jgi:hypothetical protein
MTLFRLQWRRGQNREAMTVIRAFVQEAYRSQVDGIYAGRIHSAIFIFKGDHN